MLITSHPVFGSETAKSIRRSNALNSSFRTHLRLIERHDALYLCKLQSDPAANPYLGHGSPEAFAQRRWVESYKGREAAGKEFSFVIVSAGQDHGAICLHDFAKFHGEPSFSWRRWGIPGQLAPGLAIFSALMMYEIGFDVLGYPRAHLTVQRDDRTTLAFHLRAGAEPEGEDADNIFFRYTPQAYATFRASSAEQIDGHRAVWVEVL